MFTVDASVWISAGTPDEPAHRSSRDFIDALFSKDVAVALPTLLIVEIAATIARRKKMAVALTELNEVLQASGVIQWVALDQSVAGRVAALASKSRLRAGDAVYAGVAVENGYTLVSLDQEHLTYLDGIVAVLTPEQALNVLQGINA